MPNLRPNRLFQAASTPGVAYVYASGNVADGDTVTIDGRIYEFDTAASPGAIGGDVRVDVSGGVTPSAAIAALVAAINGDTSRVVDAINAGGDVCVLIARDAGAASNYTLNRNGTNLAVSATVFGGGFNAGRLSLQPVHHAVTAQDVAVLASSLGAAEIVLAAFPSTTQPNLLALSARTSTGAVRDLTDGILTFRQANSHFWALCYAEPAAGALLVAGDTVDAVVGVLGV